MNRRYTPLNMADTVRAIEPLPSPRVHQVLPEMPLVECCQLTLWVVLISLPRGA